jgi:hypothetical protein
MPHVVAVIFIIMSNWTDRLEGTGSRSGSCSRTVLDHTAVPHLFEAVASYATRDTLLALRGTSRDVRAFVDRKLMQTNPDNPDNRDNDGCAGRGRGHQHLLITGTRTEPAESGFRARDVAGNLHPAFAAWSPEWRGKSSALARWGVLSKSPAVPPPSQAFTHGISLAHTAGVIDIDAAIPPNLTRLLRGALSRSPYLRTDSTQAALPRCKTLIVFPIWGIDCAPTCEPPETYVCSLGFSTVPHDLYLPLQAALGPAVSGGTGGRGQRSDVVLLLSASETFSPVLHERPRAGLLHHLLPHIASTLQYGDYTVVIDPRLGASTFGLISADWDTILRGIEEAVYPSLENGHGELVGSFRAITLQQYVAERNLSTQEVELHRSANGFSFFRNVYPADVRLPSVRARKPVSAATYVAYLFAAKAVLIAVAAYASGYGASLGLGLGLGASLAQYKEVLLMGALCALPVAAVMLLGGRKA